MGPALAPALPHLYAAPEPGITASAEQPDHQLWGDLPGAGWSYEALAGGGRTFWGGDHRAEYRYEPPDPVQDSVSQPGLPTSRCCYENPPKGQLRAVRDLLHTSAAYHRRESPPFRPRNHASCQEGILHRNAVLLVPV